MSTPPIKTCTLLFLLQGDKILLAMKKRGFGANRWNGVGGKLEQGETIEQACVRECQEEIGVRPNNIVKVAFHEFVFPDGIANIHVHTFIAHSWQGEPHETDEMSPQWFNIPDIPYTDMWQDDIYWLPAVLAGKRLRTKFTFNEQEQLVDAYLQEAAKDHL